MSRVREDLPRDELVRLANEVLQTMPGMNVYFKFTCAHCGSRQTFAEPNTLYTSGDCEECGGNTEVAKGGFAIMGRLG